MFYCDGGISPLIHNFSFFINALIGSEKEIRKRTLRGDSYEKRIDLAGIALISLLHLSC